MPQRGQLYFFYASSFCSCSSPEVKNQSGRRNYSQDDGQYDRVSVYLHECDDLSSISRRQVSQDHISGNSTDQERREKFSYRILHCARRKQKGNHGHRRRQQYRVLGLNLHRSQRGGRGFESRRSRQFIFTLLALSRRERGALPKQNLAGLNPTGRAMSCTIASICSFWSFPIDKRAARKAC